MVLSVPLPLEGVEQGARRQVEATLDAWRQDMWRAAQRLRRESQPSPGRPRWLGTATQLSVAIGGSVVLGGSDEAPTIVPLATEATPTVKSSPAGPLVRLEGPPNQSGRYASLSVIIDSSEGVWPAAITVGDRGGRDAGGLRAAGGRPVELQVVARSTTRIEFRLVDTATKEVVAQAESAEELAQGITSGAVPVPWAAFLEGCLWGLPAAAPALQDESRCVPNSENLRQLALLWEVEPLCREEAPLLAILGFMAKAAELPDARALANELACHWDELTDARKPILNGARLLLAVDKCVALLQQTAESTAASATAASARALDAVSAAMYFGEVLRDSLGADVAQFSAVSALQTLNSPRARRSMTQATGGSTYLTLTTTPVASPAARPRQASNATAEIDSDGDEILTPVSMRKELKRLRRLAAARTDGNVETEEPDRRVARRGRENGETTGAMRRTALPSTLTDLTDEVQPAATRERTALGETAYHADRRPATVWHAHTPTAEPTMGECVQMAHTTAVRQFIPASADGTPLKEFGALLAAGGMPAAPAAFAQAATTGTTGIIPGAGTALEAEMLADHIVAVLHDLARANTLPTDHPAFAGDVRPTDWTHAAARGRALILAAERTFRKARQVGEASGAAASVDLGAGAKKDKVPEDAYAKISEATTTSLKTLAASAAVINSLTTDAVLRGERVRGSPFETLTGHTREELDAALPGELDYFVGMYGQATTAYLVSNSRSLEEVSGKGIPAALVGIRRHLWSRAIRWVQDAYGERRATLRRTDVEKLAMSLLAGAVPAEKVGTEGEKLIVELLGGSKPHKGAEVEREGGSLSAGTTGTLEGEAAQFSVRTAYRRWAKGLARCMGEILRAARGKDASRNLVLGPDGDFGVEDALLNVSEDLPAERLRSICRYLLEEVHQACVRHRTEPAASLPDVVAIVGEMGTDVFKYRRQEHLLESMAQAAAAKIAESMFADRLRAVESKCQGSSWKSDNSRKNTKPGANQSQSAPTASTRRAEDKSHPKTQSKQDAKKPGRHVPSQAGAEMDDAPVTATAKAAARALEESMKGDPDGVLDSRMKAVIALQAEYRMSVGVAPTRRMYEKEPCAWLALVGKCKDAKCKACSSGLSFDKAMIAAVLARCADGLFDGAKRPAKEPG